ncbi:hypothetical protein ACFU7D_24665 [Nocardioides sp. NPDC057577]|uniref:hypothetical protein n=1 Tax=Nocardioides sp. NPDC057577 TaxID=3346171 RepID=UPI00366ADCA4
MSEFDGARGPAGGWWRGWTPWISALVLSALFAAATTGIAFVRKSYQPPVDYPAMTDPEPTASTAASPAPAKQHRSEAPSTRPTGAAAEPTPVKAPRKVRPSASGSGSGEPMATAEPSESPFDPLRGLGVLLGLGEED